MLRSKPRVRFNGRRKEEADGGGGTASQTVGKDEATKRGPKTTGAGLFRNWVACLENGKGEGASGPDLDSGLTSKLTGWCQARFTNVLEAARVQSGL